MTYKKVLYVLFVLVLAVMSLAAFDVCFAGEELLSSDPVLTQAHKTLEKGEDLMAKGEREMNWNPGRSFEYFKNAESEFRKAAGLYKELGAKHNIRVVNELQKCEQLEGRARVRAGKAKKEKNRKSRGFM